MKVSLVLPVLNEEKALPSVLESVPYKKLQEANFELEVIVVDNGSTDTSVQIAKNHGALVISELKKGYGSACIKGLVHATGEVVALADADGTYPLKELDKLYKIFLNNKVDLLLTDRFAKGYITLQAMPFLNKIGNFFLTGVTNILFGTKLHDTQSGMWLIKRSFLKRMKKSPTDFSFSQYVKISSIWDGKAKWIEVPIMYSSRKGIRKLNLLRDGFGNLYSLLRQRFGY